MKQPRTWFLRVMGVEMLTVLPEIDTHPHAHTKLRLKVMVPLS